VQTTQAGVTKSYFYDMNGSVVAEYEATGGTGYGALKRLNVCAAGRLLAVDEVQTDGSKVTSYLMADRQGSTRVLMNAAGAVTSRHDYFAFGEEIGAGTGAPGSPTGMRTAAQAYSAADNVRQRYADTRLDDATGLDHTLWRKLETRNGRWTTPDPLGKSLDAPNPQSFNRYAYAANDPINITDPSGLCWWVYGYIDLKNDVGNFQPRYRIVDIYRTLCNGGTDRPSGDGPSAGQRGLGRVPPPNAPEFLVDDCRIRAMLDAIAEAEGTAGDADGGYGRIVGGTVISAPNNPGLVGQTNVTITDFTSHPNILVQVRPGLTSTAAGRYQFRYATWTGLGLTDFSERNQDIGAVTLLRRAGAITSLLNGNVAQAVAAANGTWASLPASPHGQPTVALADFQSSYTNALANCNAARVPRVP
jgi:RHS repeat-associated protein